MLVNLQYMFRLFVALFCLQALLLPSVANAKTTDEKIKPVLAKIHFSKDVIARSKKLPKSITKLLKKHKIPAKNISVYIRDLNEKTPLIEHNADKLRNPASTMKLLTTYAGLKQLGPNFSWRTEVWLRGELKNGVLNGDIILKGFGDPFLVMENFWKLLKGLRNKGLKEINGDVIIDNSYFQQSQHNPSAFDGKPYRIYNAQSSALMFNFQATRFLFRPVINDIKKVATKNKKKKPKGSVEIIPHPAINNFRFINKVKLTHGRCRESHYKPKFSKNKKGVLVIKGKYSSKCKQRFILRAVSSPEEHVFNAFRETWKDLNGSLKGQLKIGKVSKGDERFHVYSSPTLGEQIRLINKWSNNVMTRQLLLTLGARQFGSPGTIEKGKRAVLAILAENQIDTQGVRLENGSGLSRVAKISAKQMADLLDRAYRDAYMPEFMASLSLPGVDGTLSKRFSRDALKGRAHLKTGTLDFVMAISGYMLNRNGKRLIVVIQHNGKRTGAGRGAKIQNALLRWSFEQ